MKNDFPTNCPKDRINDSTQERYGETKLKTKKPIFYRISFSQKPNPESVSMGYTGKLIKNKSQKQ